MTCKDRAVEHLQLPLWDVTTLRTRSRRLLTVGREVRVALTKSNLCVDDWRAEAWEISP